MASQPSTAPLAEPPKELEAGEPMCKASCCVTAERTLSRGTPTILAVQAPPQPRAEDEEDGTVFMDPVEAPWERCSAAVPVGFAFAPPCSHRQLPPLPESGTTTSRGGDSLRVTAGDDSSLVDQPATPKAARAPGATAAAAVTAVAAAPECGPFSAAEEKCRGPFALSRVHGRDAGDLVAQLRGDIEELLTEQYIRLEALIGGRQITEPYSSEYNFGYAPEVRPTIAGGGLPSPRGRGASAVVATGAAAGPVWPRGPASSYGAAAQGGPGAAQRVPGALAAAGRAPLVEGDGDAGGGGAGHGGGGRIVGRLAHAAARLARTPSSTTLATTLARSPHEAPSPASAGVGPSGASSPVELPATTISAGSSGTACSNSPARVARTSAYPEEERSPRSPRMSAGIEGRFLLDRRRTTASCPLPGRTQSDPCRRVSDTARREGRPRVSIASRSPSVRSTTSTIISRRSVRPVKRQSCLERAWRWLRKRTDARGMLQLTPVDPNTPITKPLLRRIVKTRLFDAWCGLLIVVTAVMMGVETQYLVDNPDNSNPFSIYWLIAGVWFFAELLLRIWADGKKFFYSKDWSWNYLDVVLALVSVLDFDPRVLEEDYTASKASTSLFLRNIRVLRLMRVLRLARVLRYFYGFHRTVYLINASLKQLTSLIVLIMAILYVFAVLFTMVARDALVNDPNVAAAAVAQASIAESLADRVRTGVGECLRIELQRRYGSVFLSCYTLFMSITSGVSWIEASEPLRCLSDVWLFAFLVYIAFMIFCVMNIVTSVFVDAVAGCAKQERDLLTQDHILERDTQLSHIQSVFKHVDKDGSGELSRQEVEQMLNDSYLREWLDALDINTQDAATLFELLNVDGEGNVSMEEFCEGIMSLKGEAKSYDVHVMLRELRKMHETVMCVLERNGFVVSPRNSTSQES